MSAVGFLLLLLCLSLSPPHSLSITEAEALLAFKKSITSSTGNLSNWKQNTRPCLDNWEGVVCDKGNPIIIRLRLSDMGLSGAIDVEALSQIKSLKALTLANNSFSGPLPAFNKLVELRTLYIDYNSFTGEIPGDYFAGTNLKRIWFSNNQFYGRIPTSLGTLVGLNQLHLENNKFTGPIPDISQDSLDQLDMSGNQLEGEVPAKMERFGADAFKRNAGVCGKLLGKDCKKDAGSSMTTTIGVMIGIVVVMTGLLVFTTMMKSKDKDEDFSMLRKDQMREDVVEVRVHGNSAKGGGGGGGSTRSTASQGGGGSVTGGSSKKSEDSSQKKRNEGSKKGSQNGKNAGIGDLIVINNEKGVFGLADLMKAAAEVLGNGGLGSAYKAVMANGVSVVVKRIRDMNRLNKEEFDVAIRHIGRLRHKNILTPLAYHYRNEEKLVVSEYISKGSLLYVLHGDRGISHGELNWPTRVKIIKGIASGLQFLKTEFASYELPHGNLKSSNVLLSENHEPLLSDYAFIRMVSPNQAAQGMFAYKAPEAAGNQQLSPKADIYCFGIIILELLTGKFPSQYLNAGKGGTDIIQWVRSAIEEKKEPEFLDPEIVSSSRDSLEAMIQFLHVGAAFTESDPNRRPSMEDAISRVQQITA